MPDLPSTPAIIFLTAGNLVKTDAGGVVVVGLYNQITFALTKREAEATSHHLRLIAQIWSMLITANVRHFDSDTAIRPYNQLIYRTDTTDLVAEIQIYQCETCLVLSKKSFRHTNKILILDVEKLALENFFICHFPQTVARLRPIGAERAAVAAAYIALTEEQQHQTHHC